MKHNADFKFDLEWGKQGEAVVADIVAGQSTEVKSERDIWLTTYNHFVEVESRGKPSGIMKTEATWWTVNFYKKDRFLFNITLSVKDLKKMIKLKTFRKIRGGDNNTSWGYLVPIKDLINCMNYDG